VVNLAIVIVLAYLVGSIPTSIIVSKVFHGFDIREKGSRNAGGTNVFRVIGWKAGLFVILFDIGKAVVATTVIARLFWDPNLPFENRTPFDDLTIVQIICGTAAVLGHIYTVFAGFRGGKGIAAGAGMLIGIAPTEFAICVGAFLIVSYISKYISLGSIVAAMMLPASLFFRQVVLHDEIPSYKTMFVFGLIVAGLLVYAHRANIKRLIEGTEHKFSFSKKKT
jgi:glycerol-3-phosphate acyltransferase PlsY